MTTYRKTMTEMYQQVRERTLTPTELKRREEIAKDLPLKDFEKRYGKEKGMQVKMAVATKMAKKESFELRELSTQDALVVRAKQLAQKKNDLKARIEIANKIEIKSPSLFKYYRELEKKGDKSSPAVKKFDKQLMSALAKKFGQDVAKKTEKALKEELNEDGHSDVSSMIRKCKTVIEDANEIMSKLNSMDKEGSLPTWWTNKLAVASNSMNKMRDYILNPIEESVIMEKEGDLEDMKKVVAELKGASKKHLSQAVRIDRLDLKNETLDTICDELRTASKMHLGQSKRVQAHIGMMEGEATDAAKELIDREKERMKDKHDRIMQRAKIKDVTDASRERQGEN
jgi:hypothetical protein|tara:strand:+ start:1664 stop:2689 length:1026 start_codon:yes stop_codon:yes gene_type:complete